MNTRSLFAAAAALAVLSQVAVGAEHQHAAHSNSPISTPPALKQEHEQLHKQMAMAIESGGDTAEAAKKVQQRLRPHFIEEEEYAMPPLGLLVPLSQGKVTEEMRPAIEMAEKLRSNYQKMLEEHQGIVEALKELAKAAKQENKPAQAAFARKLILHAQNEEQVLYPTTLLIGDYLKMKLDQKAGTTGR